MALLELEIATKGLADKNKGQAGVTGDESVSVLNPVTVSGQPWLRSPGSFSAGLSYLSVPPNL